jgi:predicted polyphosphate/ATP-dependent NAD kinase
MMSRRVGLVVNPIAGMGGRVGLKGTDGVLDEAIARGARPQSGHRAAQMVKRFRELAEATGGPDVIWVTSSGTMGEDALREGGVPPGSISVVHAAPQPARTAPDDTKEACLACEREGVEVVVFCGGDGTARDVTVALGLRVPVLGIPAGVKMHSGVFGVSPAAAAETLLAYLQGRVAVAEADVIDLDEDAYRSGEWAMRLQGVARTPFEPSLMQGGKLMVEVASDREVLIEISEAIREYMEESPGALWLLGPGGTLKFVGDWLHIDKTLLGIDAVVDGAQVGKDLEERGILQLLDRWPSARVVVSPIGAQGFFLGRGNLQLSPEVVRRVGVDNFLVVSTPSKLERTPVLRVDTGDDGLNAQFMGMGRVYVLVGYRTRKPTPFG